jgi:hypothetical protein
MTDRGCRGQSGISPSQSYKHARQNVVLYAVVILPVLQQVLQPPVLPPVSVEASAVADVN